MTVFKKERVGAIANSLSLSRTMVSSIIDQYIASLIYDLYSGKTVKVFNICYLRVRGDSDEPRKTLAYISTEIAKDLAIGSATVFRVLSEFENSIVEDLQNGDGCTLRGLVRIQTEEENGTHVRIRKSTNFNGSPLYVSTLGSFRRRVYGG